MEVQLLGPRPPGLTRSQPVFALHGPNAATELGSAALLQVGAGPAPLHPCTTALIPFHALVVQRNLLALAAMLSSDTLWLQAAQLVDAPLLMPLLAVEPRKQPMPAAMGTAGSTAAQVPLSKVVQTAAEQHQLNPEQAAVLAQVETWSSPAASEV
jgi:hypothetical protein